jgi:geranylgeranyl diphosphate synthase type II
LDLADYLERERAEIDGTLDRLLPAAEGPAATLAAAMRHAVLGGGKRLRPALVVASHEACGGSAGGVREVGAALEMIHTYSLIHDDLPAMDDDDLRRGRPTVHKVFGEAQAILAGDALLTLAFELLGRHPEGEAAAGRRSRAVIAAARAAGAAGMVGGQLADLEAEGERIGAERLRWIHRHKTGALFSACCEVGAIHAGAPAGQVEALAAFGRAIGLAFQIADDLLDLTGDPAALGKTPGKDERAQKATYPALLGEPASREEALALVGTASEQLRRESLLSEPLAGLAQHAVTRAS